MSVPVLWAMPFEQQPPLAHCMPTYVPYVFFEDSRGSIYIEPVSVFVAVVLTFCVALLEVEAWMQWSSDDPPSQPAPLSFAQDRTKTSYMQIYRQ